MSKYIYKETGTTIVPGRAFERRYSGFSVRIGEGKRILVALAGFPGKTRHLVVSIHLKKTYFIIG